MTTCPKCNKKFATKNALAQHIQAKHPAGGETQQPEQQTKARGPRRRKNRGGTQPRADKPGKLSIRRIAGGIKLTPAGIAFLKCAFAPPDFAETGVKGVPDSFCGRSVLSQYHTTGTISVAPGTTSYIVLLPVPGFRYFTVLGLAGNDAPIINSTVLSGNPFPQWRALAPTPAAQADQVSAYRIISNHIELCSLNNQNNWSGQIRVWKTPIKMALRAAAAAATTMVAEGLNGLNFIPTKHEAFTSWDGCYTAAYRDAPDFEFQPILEAYNAIPPVLDAAVDFGQVYSGDGLGFPGLDNDMEAVVIKIDGVTGVAQNFMVKNWQCCELQPNASSVISTYASFSPDHDQNAIDIYKKVIKQLPMAVKASENANFWSKVWSIIRGAGSFLARVPGPVGLVATAANAVGDVIDAF